MPELKASSLNRIVGALVALLCLVALWMWHSMPLIPDEIAIRVQAGRFIQDNGIAQSLYAMCSSRAQPVPWMFVPSAWLLSLGDLYTNPVQLRFAAAALLLGFMFMVGRNALKHSNIAALLWMPAVVLGVAGSSLVYFRFEAFLLIHLCLCMAALDCIRKNTAAVSNWMMAAGLVFTLLTTSYVHPQSLLFVPLTAYLCYRLIGGKAIAPVKIGACAIVFGAIAVTTHLFFKLSCDEYKEIETFWGEMVFDITRLFSADALTILIEKFKLYSVSFGYNQTYTINYLPGITSDDFAAAQLFNAIIAISLFAIILTGIAISCYLAAQLFTRFVLRHPVILPFNVDAAIVFALIFFPTLFYFLYDAHLYFYRSFFLNFLFVMSIIIALCEFKGRRVHNMTAIAGGVLCILVLLSVIANAIYFYKPIKTYEGPSAALSRDWQHAPQNLDRFAQRCGIDLTQGGGIIDDLTYEGVKQYGRVYQITYLGLQMSLAHIKPKTVISLLKPNYVLARCTEMEAIGLGWPADKQEGELCCKRYSPAPQ